MITQHAADVQHKVPNVQEPFDRLKVQLRRLLAATRPTPESQRSLRIVPTACLPITRQTTALQSRFTRQHIRTGHHVLRFVVRPAPESAAECYFTWLFATTCLRLAETSGSYDLLKHPKFAYACIVRCFCAVT